MYNMNPYADYKQQAIMTMTSGELLITLYDEAIKVTTAAKMHIEAKQIEKSHKSLLKAQLIVKHLRDVLDGNYAVATELDRLYEYVMHNLQQANMKKDCVFADNALNILIELRDTFTECDKEARKQHYGNTTNA